MDRQCSELVSILKHGVSKSQKCFLLSSGSSTAKTYVGPRATGSSKKWEVDRLSCLGPGSLTELPLKP